MITKKFFSILSSMIILSSTVTALTSNAVYIACYKDGEEYDNFLKESGYTEFNDYGIFLWAATQSDGYTIERYLENREPYRCFYKNNSILISEAFIEQDVAVFSVPVEKDNEELISSIISEAVPEWTYIRNTQMAEYFGIYNYILSTDWKNEEAYEKAMVLCAELNEEGVVEEFNFHGRHHSHTVFDYPTDKLYFEAEGFDEAAISQHLDSYDIAYEINEITEREIPLSHYREEEAAYSLTLSDESTWQDYIYVKSLIDEKFDVGIDYAIPESASGFSGTEIDILSQINSSYGDMNNSGGIDVSDAVSLMAYATNPEAYPLTDLQILLGDVYQQGDGIGINDAVSIQKYLTKQINSLPESTM